MEKVLAQVDLSQVCDLVERAGALFMITMISGSRLTTAKLLCSLETHCREFFSAWVHCLLQKYAVPTVVVPTKQAYIQSCGIHNNQ